MRDRPCLDELALVDDPAVQAIRDRQLAAGERPVEAWRARLAALAGPGEPLMQEAVLAMEIRSGARDDDRRLLDHLRATVRAKLAENAPCRVSDWPLLDP